MHRKNPTSIGGDFNLPDIDWKVKSINNYQYWERHQKNKTHKVQMFDVFVNQLEFIYSGWQNKF